MAKGKVSGKTHSQAQLNNYANQHNPNNKACVANRNNHANQLNPTGKTHQQIHNSQRRNPQSWVPWYPDYPEYD